jgi:preprotein translocase subunit SecA
VEYQREGFELFAAMMDAIKEESVGYLFNVEVQLDAPADEATEPAADEVEAAATPAAPAHRAPEIKAKGLEAPARPSRLEYSAPAVDGEAREIHSVDAVDEPPLVVSEDANRAERRRAARANRKRKR